MPYEYYAFFRNNRDGTYQYASVVSQLARATRPFGGWGIGAFDFDNDGRKDLFLANSHVMGNIEVTQPSLHYLQPPQLLRYAGGKFTDISGESGAIFHRTWAARGAAFGDLDNDGYIDIVVSDYNANLSISPRVRACIASSWLLTASMRFTTELPVKDLKMNRRTCLTSLVAGATVAICQTDGDRAIQLHVDLSVDPAKHDEMLRVFHSEFRPAASKQPGFKELQMLRLRSPLSGTPPDGANYRFVLTFESEEQRRQWV